MSESPIDTGLSHVFSNHEVTLGVLSLIVPQMSTMCMYGGRLALDDTRIAVTETPPATEPDMPSLSITRLAKSLCEKETFQTGRSGLMMNSYIVLFTPPGHQSLGSDPVLGMYFSGPIFMLDHHDGKPVYSVSLTSSSSCMMLQLWPEVRVEKWKGHGNDLVKMLSGDDTTCEGSKITELALAQIAMGCEKSEEDALSRIPYSIGWPNSDSTPAEDREMGLHINPVEGTVTLTIKPSERAPGSAQIGNTQEACEVRLANAEMHIFTVSGGAVVGSPMGRPFEQDLSRYTRDENVVPVAGEELKSRIQGFGSS